MTMLSRVIKLVADAAAPKKKGAGLKLQKYTRKTGKYR